MTPLRWILAWGCSGLNQQSEHRFAKGDDAIPKQKDISDVPRSAPAVG